MVIDCVIYEQEMTFVSNNYFTEMSYIFNVSMQTKENMCFTPDAMESKL